jgi:hypothetical protein
MSQEVSTNPRASKPLTNSTSTQPWSAEADADKLMDDLFSDIDRILDGGSKLPTDPVKPEYISLQPIVMPQLPMPPAVIPAQELEQEPITEPTETMPVELVERRELQFASSPAKQSGWSLEKLLLIGGITSLVVTLLLVLASQHKLTLPEWLNFSGSSSTQSGQLSPSDHQFVAYMLRSIQVIDHKSKTNQKTATTASASGVANQQPVNLQSGSTASIRPNPPQTVLERIYIPVYPPQAPLPQPTTPATTRPSFQAISPAAKPPVKAPAPVTKLSPPSPVARLSRPSTPPQSLPALPPAPPPAAVVPSVAVAASSVSDPKHTLVGLLELGDRSAALFDVSGTTQRIKIGEAIGASGWTLVSVANQEAVIRRNGEVRSVYVGQKF